MKPVPSVALPYLHADLEWDFQVRLPHAPRSAKPPKADSDAPSNRPGLAARIWVSATPDHVFTVGAAQGQPVGSPLPPITLAGTPKAATAAVSGRLRSSRAVNQPQYQGVYYVIDFTRDGRLERKITQEVKSGERTYLLLVNTTPDRSPESYAAFFGSFKIGVTP